MESPRRTCSSRLTYAKVMATIAVFAVLGGTGYAAVALPNASVGNAQLKANAVDSSKVINGSLLKADFKPGQLPKGAKGAKGAAGSTGANGATGASGAKGDKGDSFTLATVLPSGQTEKGQYAVWGGGGAGAYIGGAYAFRVPLAAGIPAANVHFLAAPNVFTPSCPAAGQAAAGHMCVYEKSGGAATIGGIYAVTNGVVANGATSNDGFQIYFAVTAVGAWSYGEYAVTAP